MSTRDHKTKFFEQWIAAVAVIFNREGKILLTKRHQPESEFHDRWQLPGGGVEYGENPIDTIVREIKEETGLSIDLISEFPSIYSAHRPDSHGIILSFPARYTKGEIDISRDDETGDFGWFFENEIEFNNTLPGTEEMVRTARKRYLELKRKY